MPSQDYDACRSTLRLFMSVDIVGSTAFKQGEYSASDILENRQPSPPSAAWFSAISQFYKQIEILFAQGWRLYDENKRKPADFIAGDPPEFWKSVGDEIIYIKTIKTHLDACCCVNCWINAINSYRKTLTLKFPKLNIKSTAWIAGFPVNNSEVILGTNVATAQESEGGSDPAYDNVKLLTKYHCGERHNLVRDFIGPSVDIGFRLGSLASPHKMVISVDLALLLASAENHRPHEFIFAPMKFFFDGAVSLKGVLSGVPYPILWIDLLGSDNLELAEDKLSGRGGVSSSDVVSYCEEFIAKHGPRIIRPYFEQGSDQRFSTVPNEHKDRITALRAYIQNEAGREQELVRSEEKQNQNGDDVSDDALDAVSRALRPDGEN